MSDETKKVLPGDQAPIAGARQVVPGPHIDGATSCSRIMLLVIGALLPAVLWSLWNLGVPAAIVYASCIIPAVLTEFVWNAVLKRQQTIGDFTAVLTGILLAMCMPPLTPWWICMVGGVVSIALAKMIFGGLGFNLFNPALVGRAVALLSWLGVMGELKPFSGGWSNAITIPASGKLDAINGATRLAVAAADRAAQGAYGFSLPDQYNALLFRNLEGCVGEVSAALLIAGGLFLIAVKVVDWRIPVGYIGSVALLSWAFGSDPIFNVLAGGVVLGAFFMATDYVTSPITKSGRLVFGIGCGVFNIVTRFFGPMPETTTFAILFMNGLAPLIDRAFLPKPFGWVKPAKEVKADA
ncbi:MAG: RnfABCDGE type electron transport complex subunit D [Coriobacteriia bacterium]|nr:RnfABCDGE type electron transport complex subunit D [Coriobacteriia bacterium]